MDVEKYAPFTSSPLDSSRGRVRRRIFPRLRPTTSASTSSSASTSVVFIIPKTATATSATEQTIPQVGGSSFSSNNGSK